MMRFLVLAADYDGTLADHGRVNEPTLRMLRRLKHSGRRLLIVTGRELPDLLHAFPAASELCERIVAENGAVVFHPERNEVQALAPAPPGAFVERLRERGVRELSVGRVIIGTHEPFEKLVLEVIRELGLEQQVIFNKGAVMILPSGLNKATGLTAALQAIGISSHNVVGIGDAENDHAFLQCCECAVAVANALPALRESADFVTSAAAGAGVTELGERLLADDLASLEPRLSRHDLVIGATPVGATLSLPPVQTNLLVAGTSRGGKSTLLTSILERLIERGYQALVIDPEGDHAGLDGAVVLGSSRHAPTTDELVGALRRGPTSVVANLISVPAGDKPDYMRRLLPPLADLRATRGRPHRVVLDEAHHLFPAGWEDSVAYRALHLPGFLAATVDATRLAGTVLQRVDVVVATGSAPAQALQEFCSATGAAPPTLPTDPLPPGAALAWWRREATAQAIHCVPPRSARRRHVRKYAQGELDETASFYFEGPEGKLHLRAQNLQLFLQIAEGVDDATWQFHLEHGDYSAWVRTHIKDDELADALAAVEREAARIDPQQSRATVRHEIASRYTAAA